MQGQTSDKEKRLEYPVPVDYQGAYGRGAYGYGQESEGLEVREILHVLIKYYKVIVFFVLLVFGGTVLYTLNQTKIYRATSTIRIDLIPRNAMGEVWQFFVPSPGLSVNPDFYETHFKLLESRHVAEAVAASLPAAARDKLGADPGEAVLGLVTIEPVKDTRLVRIHADHPDPDFAELLSRAYADGYEQHNLETAVGSLRRAAKWLGRQLEESRGKVEAAELKLYDFKQRHKISTASLDERQSLISATILQQNTMAAEAEAQRLRLEARLQELRALRDSGDVDALALAIEDPGVAELKKRYLALAQKKSMLLERYKEKHPDVMAVSAELERIDADLKREVDRRLRSLETQYLAAKGAESRLTQSLEGSKRESLDLSRHEIEFNRLLRETENARQIHSLLLKRSKENALSDVEFDNNVRRVGEVTRVGEPIRPRPKLNGLLGLLVGLLGGVGLAFFLSAVDSRIYTREQLERRTGLVHLGIFPTTRTRERGKLWTGDRPFVEQHPQSSAAECARIVRTNLIFALGEAEADRGRCILITSAEPQVGKSTLTANLGVVLAELGRRVLLIEGDLRRPSLRRKFGLEREGGLGDLLDPATEIDGLARPTGVKGLDIVGGGKLPDNPGNLLESNRFAAFIEWGRKEYDVVLIDSPPVLVVADTLLIHPRTDGVVLVGQSGSTHIDSIALARRQLEESGAKILGAIINHVDMRRRENRYYYYYYHKYGDYYVRVKRRSRFLGRTRTKRRRSGSTDEAPPPGPPA